MEFAAVPRVLPEFDYSELPEMAADIRKREFYAGRIAASNAMNICGLPNLFPSRAVNGMPVWPRGVVGSISHSFSHACAAVSTTPDVRSIGIDIEPLDSVGKLSELRGIFLNADEMMFDEREQLIAYSAKETFFKMIYPMSEVFFGFEAASVEEFLGNHVTIISHETIGSFPAKSRFQISYDVREDHILTIGILGH